MKILVVGAGAIGAYFGARLLEAGVDTTFLVRPKRQAQLRAGLFVRSPHGDIRLPAPPTVTAERVQKGFGLVLLSCKAYDLPGAIESLAPAVDAGTAILPLLNGMRHLDALTERFGPERILGGLCLIAATLGEDGSVIHLNDNHAISFGELAGARTPRAETIEALLAKAKFQSRLSETIVQEMWEKWVFIAALAGSTCLMRAAVGDIVRSGNAELLRRMLSECAQIAASRGFAPRPQAMARAEAFLTDADSTLTASMMRDLEHGARTEADHILGDLLARRGPPAADLSLLDVAFAQLKSNELRRTREVAATRAPQ
ncbi:MAG TPA: 2-dehydropantoate 2-reductase [Burkholderiaceae bacterium]|jgi:2-dehydropantoate 2-reductase|nr:2-dehydropantoate 2-reductase [Burkholderiaceae bacterium]